MNGGFSIGTARPGNPGATRERRGRAIPLPANERCLAVVYLAAAGDPGQCLFRRRDGPYCARHQRERIAAS